MGLIRFGIIGCSRVAENRFIPTLLTSKKATLGMVGSRDTKKAKRFAETFQCETFGTYQDVLTDPLIDAVYISVPVTLREEVLQLAIENRKHMLIEKPAFMDWESAAKYVSLCRKKNLRMLEGWSFRYHPQHQQVKRIIDSGAIGRLRYFHGQFTYPTPPEGNIRLQSKLGGGVFFDSAGYPIVAARMYLGDNPVSVHCTLHNHDRYGVDDFVQIQLQYENTVVANTIAGFGLQYNSTYSLLGSKGSVEVGRAYAVDSSMTTVIKLETDDGVQNLEIEPQSQFLLMLDAFCSYISQETTPPYDFEYDLLIQNLIMDVARQASANDQPLQIGYDQLHNFMVSLG